MSLPTVVEELLVDVVGDGFVLYCCGPKAAPNALVAAYEWERWLTRRRRACMFPASSSAR